MRNPVAARVLVKMLYAFMTKHDSEQSVQVIEDYVMNGLDKGVTDRVFGSSCSLPPSAGAALLPVQDAASQLPPHPHSAQGANRDHTHAGRR